MKKLLIALCTYIMLVPAAVPIQAAITGQEFSYISQPAFNIEDSKGFFVFEIEPSVFASMDTSLKDLRIMDKKGLETGYARLEPEGKNEQLKYQTLNIINKGMLQNSDTYSFTVENVPAPMDLMTVKLDNPEYLVKADVFGSNDNRTWQEVGVQTLYGINGNYNSFSLAGVRYTYLKFEYAVPRGQTLGAAEAACTVGPRAAAVPLTGFSIKQTDGDKKSTVVVDLGSRNQNSVSVRLTAGENNFYRRAQLESGNDGKQWMALTSFYLYRGTQSRDENLTAVYPLTQARYLRITVYNDDNQPVRFTEAQVGLRPVRLLVKGQTADAPFRLYWGNQKMSVPSYDLEDLMNQGRVEAAALPVVKVSSFETNPQFKKPVVPLTERYPFLLPAAMVVAVMVVGLLLLKSFKKVDA